MYISALTHYWVHIYIFLPFVCEVVEAERCRVQAGAMDTLHYPNHTEALTVLL
jgi:hypothetical protein